MKLYLSVFLLILPVFGMAKSSYYELSCEEQAGNIQNITKLRDKGYSKGEINRIIKETYMPEHYEVLASLLDTVFTLKSQSPRDMYLTVKGDCENHGRSTSHTPLFGDSEMKARGYLSSQEMKSCIELRGRLESAREKLTSYERELEIMDTILKDSMAQINSSQDKVSNNQIEKHNQSVAKFGRLNNEYQSIATGYNLNAEVYNRECAGKARK